MNTQYISRITDLIDQSNESYIKAYIDHVSHHTTEIDKSALLSLLDTFRSTTDEKRCEHIYKRGKRANEQCTVVIKNKNFCSKHTPKQTITTVTRTSLETDLLAIEDEDEEDEDVLLSPVSDEDVDLFFGNNDEDEF